MANPLRPCYLWLVLLLLSGACQRATYSFQAPASAPLVAAMPLATTAGSDSLAGATEAADHQITRPQQPANRQATAQVQRPRRRPMGLARRAAQPLARMAQRAAASVAPAQEPLPVRTRSRGVALLLVAIPALLGFPVGLHNFYLGRIGRGIVTILLALVAYTLLSIGAAGAFFGLLFGVDSTLATIFVVGAIMYAGLFVWQVVDAILIATGSLLPRNGVYRPKFF